MECWCQLSTTSGIAQGFPCISPSSRHVSHVLLRRSPLAPKCSFDLHVLGTPPAFVLSHDQTLRRKCWSIPTVLDLIYSFEPILSLLRGILFTNFRCRRGRLKNGLEFLQFQPSCFFWLFFFLYSAFKVPRSFECSDIVPQSKARLQHLSEKTLKKCDEIPFCPVLNFLPAQIFHAILNLVWTWAQAPQFDVREIRTYF